MSNFFRRTFTGAGIVIFVLGGFWLHPLTFFISGLILLTGILYEYYKLAAVTGVNTPRYTGIIAGASIYTISTLAARGTIQGKWLLLVLLVIPAIVTAEIYRQQQKPFHSLSHTIFGITWAAMPFCLMPFSAYNHTGTGTLIPVSQAFSPGLVIGFFLLVWANDTGAYLVGVSAGRHKLMERISPKKTWEGFAGGMITAAAVSLLLPGFLGITGKSGWIASAVIVSVAGTYGDLAESMLKRSAGVKDSGNILPGHGGFLDRFDSTIMAFPLVYLFVSLFG